MKNQYVLFLIVFTLIPAAQANAKMSWRSWQVMDSAQYSVVAFEKNILTLNVRYEQQDCNGKEELKVRGNFESSGYGWNSESGFPENHPAPYLYVTVEGKELLSQENCQAVKEKMELVSITIPQKAVAEMRGDLELVRISGAKFVNAVWVLKK